MVALSNPAPIYDDSHIDSRRAWIRLGIAVALSAIGGVGMWSVVVALPAVQEEFGVQRAGASFPYALAMVGFAFGGILMGRIADRFGIVFPLVGGACALALGYILAGFSTSILQFALAHGILIGLLGSSASFGPLIAEISHWFQKRRGIAVAVCASGNYLAGTFWPPVVQFFIAEAGWRATHIGIGLFCLVTMIPLAMLLRKRAPALPAPVPGAVIANPAREGLGLSTGTLQTLLLVAGVSCCVAMAMPQVHIVAYCTDLDIGAARGAEMLSLMLAFGIVSRIASGFIADRIGGLATLLLGSSLQGFAIVLFVLFDGMAALYIISALFGLFQGGIVPSYAIVVREYFPQREAGMRVGVVLMATLFGMAFGGWLSGAIFDWTGSYDVAFLNGVAWNLLNIAIISFLLMRRGGMRFRRVREGSGSGGVSGVPA
ncbi:MAG: Sugar phosphate permease [Saliniramus fredricksonii]|uniref:Sugar phosphate permease n=1 Tax=Saliniramus fredricksonii TaxID=1653334 RepID=A0A0P7Y0M7_9HYPH|nr:MFS transporter [Saliniramus fredricksonii]KPQ09848.1 MAG: Sugar phosphate permease [Saliniramus fredricksonii]SCC82165.1 Sugar phosphate permease [Saliniramus fredricksonii]